MDLAELIAMTSSSIVNDPTVKNELEVISFKNNSELKLVDVLEEEEEAETRRKVFSDLGVNPVGQKSIMYWDTPVFSKLDLKIWASYFGGLRELKHYYSDGKKVPDRALIWLEECRERLKDSKDVNSVYVFSNGENSTEGLLVLKVFAMGTSAFQGEIIPIARWGVNLPTFKQVVNIAMKRFSEDRREHLIKLQELADRLLKNLDKDVESSFLGVSGISNRPHLNDDYNPPSFW